MRLLHGSIAYPIDPRLLQVLLLLLDHNAKINYYNRDLGWGKKNCIFHL
jgi:hypothetical protein